MAKRTPVPYLIAHPPRIRQFKARGRKPTGLIVVHTAESAPDEQGPDTGTLGVAGFIQSRDTYGSYHGLADSDSRLPVVPFELQAYGDGTGSNPFAIHISLATQAHLWERMMRGTPAQRAWVDGAIEQLAALAVDAAEWLLKEHGIVVPAVRVTREQSDDGRPGFISHGERDPGRRTDPGTDFPWDRFLTAFAAERARRAAGNAPKPGRIEVYAQRRRLTQLAQALKPGRLRDLVKASRDRLPKPPRRKTS